MSNSVLYPVTVSAKVVPQGPGIKVPSLGGAAFNRDSVLEPGVHVHWALPDSLTAATLVTDGPSQGALFRAVPDLWLVIRLNPGSSSSTPTAKRSWQGWVVDSIAQTATPLASWKPPTRDASKVHTLAGLLPDAGAPNGGRGLLSQDIIDAGNGFSPYMAAYYPAMRGRFGFYDKLADLPNKQAGNVSYLVVGWYWNDRFDPLSSTFNPHFLLQKWNAESLAGEARTVNLQPRIDISKTIGRAAFPIAATGATERSGEINLRGDISVTGAPLQDLNLQIRPVNLPDATRLVNTQRLNARAGTTVRRELFDKMAGKFRVPSVTLPPNRRFLSASIYHGSVMAVPLGSPAGTGSIPTNAVKLSQNIMRAMADFAGLGDDNSSNAAEMLLANMNAQNSSTAGVLDMPGATHAMTFQSATGVPKRYLRIEVASAPQATNPPGGFVLQGADAAVNKVSGYWPAKNNLLQSQIGPQAGLNFKPFHPPLQPKAPPPTEAECTAFRAQVRAAFTTALAALQGSPQPPDAQLLRVQDNRPNARSLKLGQTTQRTGSDSAGWWIDITDDNALDELLTTTSGDVLGLPDSKNLYELPGPRWYRPWAPQVVLTGLDPSYKFGFDGRFSAEGKIRVRRSGQTVVGLAVGSQPKVFGRDLIVNESTLNIPGLPTEIVALVRETLLLDTESSGVMAATVAPNKNVQGVFADGIRGVWLARDASFQAKTSSAVKLDGDEPSPLALTPWKDPTDPLFLDTRYAYAPTDPANWTLPESEVEVRLKQGSTSPMAVPPAIQEFSERTQVTVNATTTVKSMLVKNMTIDPYGTPVVTNKSSKDLTKTLDSVQVISAPLTGMDANLFASGARVRSGALMLKQLSLVDIFGLTKEWSAPIAISAPNASSAPYWVPLPMRYPFWSRLNLRLQSAANPQAEATPQAGPVCGLLLPDLLEHTLEVFDTGGNALGQLSTDAPVTSDNGGKPLTVRYTPHPWIEPNADPFHAITDPILRSLVESLTQQGVAVPTGNTKWVETGLSAMLRVIDTVRGTQDGKSKKKDPRVNLIGQPILVMPARLQFNGTEQENEKLLGSAPPPVTAPPAIPQLTVRIGDAIRPDDGVLGLFVAGATPAIGRFASVSRQSVQSALLNGLAPGAYSKSGTMQVTHPFVTGEGRAVQQPNGSVAQSESLVTLPANIPMDVVLLADPGFSIYATCGVLPRKKIQVPSTFVDDAIANLQPSFYTGPVLALKGEKRPDALIPPPEVPGYTVSFTFQQKAAAAAGAEWQSLPVSAVPPTGELPGSRVQLTEGWLRLKKGPAASS